MPLFALVLVRIVWLNCAGARFEDEKPFAASSSARRRSIRRTIAQHTRRPSIRRPLHPVLSPPSYSPLLSAAMATAVHRLTALRHRERMQHTERRVQTAHTQKNVSTATDSSAIVRTLPSHLSIVSLLRRLRHEPRAVQLQIVDHVQQHFLTQTAMAVTKQVVALPPVQLAVRGARQVVSAGHAAQRAIRSLHDRLYEASVGRVARSLPFRLVCAYTNMILADIAVARQLHQDAARDPHSVHSSSHISSTNASYSLSPLSPGASKLAAVGWRTRRFVFALARFTGQSRRHLWGRSLRHWPLDALSLWFQLLLLALPPSDPTYDNVRESLTDCLRWYEVRDPSPDDDEQVYRAGGGARWRMQIEGLRSPDDQDEGDESFLASLDDSSASPARFVRMRADTTDTIDTIDGYSQQPHANPLHHLSTTAHSGGISLQHMRHASSPIEFASNVSTASNTPLISPSRLPSTSPSPPGLTSASLLQLPSTRSSPTRMGHGRFRSQAAPFNSTGGGRTASRNLSMSSLDSINVSHAHAVYNRALDLLAREGIDLHNISMNDTMDHDESAAAFAAAAELGSASDASEWSDHSHSVGPRELGADSADEVDEVATRDPRREEYAAEQERTYAAAVAAVAASASSSSASLGALSRSAHSHHGGPGVGVGASSPSTSTIPECSENGLSEFDRTTEEPGRSGFGTASSSSSGKQQLTPEGMQRPAFEAIDEFPPLPSSSAPSAPLPILHLPVWIHSHIVSRLAAQRLLDSLLPLLSQICFSHTIRFEVLNKELQGWNQRSKAAATLSAQPDVAGETVAASADASASAASSPAPSSLRAPPFHLLVHTGTTPSSSAVSPLVVDSLVRLLDDWPAEDKGQFARELDLQSTELVLCLGFVSVSLRMLLKSLSRIAP